MKFSQDAWMGLFFTVAAAVAVWFGKLVLKWISSAIKKAVLEEVNERLDTHDDEIKEAKMLALNLKSIVEENRATIKILIESLINKNK